MSSSCSCHTEREVSHCRKETEGIRMKNSDPMVGKIMFPISAATTGTMAYQSSDKIQCKSYCNEERGQLELSH